MWSIEAIKQAFGGRLVGNNFMKNMVVQAVTKLPDEIIEHVTKHVWFLSSSEDAWAYTFKGSDVSDKHLIFLSDELLSEDEPQIQYTILHEIGHVILNHKNSIHYRQSKEEISLQESEADKFAKRYLR